MNLRNKRRELHGLVGGAGDPAPRHPARPAEFIPILKEDSSAPKSWRLKTSLIVAVKPVLKRPENGVWKARATWFRKRMI